jgi:Flp pilus assembly protein TadD
MHRFNRAWLLDPDSYGVPWGYGIVAWHRNQDLTAAQRFFAKAEAKALDDPWVVADHGRVLRQAGQVEQGLDLMSQAARAHPDNEKLTGNMAACRMEAPSGAE